MFWKIWSSVVVKVGRDLHEAVALSAQRCVTSNHWGSQKAVGSGLP